MKTADAGVNNSRVRDAIQWSYIEIVNSREGASSARSPMKRGSN